MQRPAPTRWEVLGGATDWRWEESFDDQRMLLESGWAPTLRGRVHRDFGRWRLVGDLETVYGDIAYEGALQDLEGKLRSYDSRTHYFAGSGEGGVGFPLRPESRMGLVPSLHLGYHRWIRTIDSDQFNTPGRYGYLETWQHVAVQPRLGAEIALAGRDRILLEAGLRVPVWTLETIAGLAGTSEPVDLEPGTATAFRAMFQVRLGRILIETEWLSLPFRASPAVTVPLRIRTPDGTVQTIQKDLYQPDSDLRRIDLRAGAWF
jgi:hypothetical protein